MSETIPLKELPDGWCNWVYPTAVESGLTGVHFAKQSKDGRVTLEYSDGTTETAHCELDIVMADNFLDIVAAVQDQRKD